MEITSVNNQRVKDAVKLRQRRQRAAQGRFVIDGAREILRAMQGQIAVDELFVCDEQCQSSESQQVQSDAGRIAATVWRVTREVMEKLAFGERTAGLLAVAKTPTRLLAQLMLPAGSLVAVLEGIEKPGNVGAVLRSADGAGVSAVIVADPLTDLWNPNCIRASLGTVFTVPVGIASSVETIAWLQSKGFKMFTARLDASCAYTDVDYRGNAAIVLGSEAAGISQQWKRFGATGIKLPMHGAADSLNVSATAAVLFYEAMRQRGRAINASPGESPGAK